MARMSIDDSVTRDARVLVLAKLTGWNRYETLGHLLDVWAACYDRVTPYLSEMIVDASACFDGFAKHMVTAELACIMDDGSVRIAGVEARIGYLNDKAKAGRKGGIKSGETRRNRHEAESKQTRSKHEASGNPIPIVPDPVPPPVPDPDGDKAPDRENKKAASPKAPRIPSGPHQQAIAEFDAYFARVNNGARPTWNGQGTKLMADLVKTHGLPEIVRRISVLERSPPNFPPVPWDMRTFSQHFDKIAAPRNGADPNRPILRDLTKRGDLRNGDLLALQLERVAEAEAREREENHD